ncbi:MAG: hypothetical protein IJ906_15290, partial [Oscillospiraceae bacterium]|nr:hypothetical protein [Oscillospiraceae bacterium]
SEENRVLRTLCFVLQAAQNPSHAFPNAACGGYKQLNELSCLNGNSMIMSFTARAETSSQECISRARLFSAAFSKSDRVQGRALPGVGGSAPLPVITFERTELHGNDHDTEDPRRTCRS